MKYLFHLSYKGTNYSGWQKQPNAPSVQEVLEEAFSKMTKQSINCIGCGRTDAGVHSSGFRFHIKVQEAFAYDPIFRLNKMLPDAIAVHDYKKVPPDFHAQHSAKWRTYVYRIHGKKNPFLNDFSAYYPTKNLSLLRMQELLSLLMQYKEYRAFCKRPDIYKSTQCQIKSATLDYYPETDELALTVTANRFLRGMMRILVANILEVGYNNLSIQSFEECLKTGQRPPFFKEAYPQGLNLSDVIY